MLQLLAHSRGFSADRLIATCLHDPSLAEELPGLACRLEGLVGALPPFLRRPGPCRPQRDLLLLPQGPLVDATKERYAPGLLAHEHRLVKLARRRLSDAVAWRRGRSTVVETPVATFHKPPPPQRRAEPPATIPSSALAVTLDWKFDSVLSHKDLRTAAEATRVSKVGSAGSARTAVVSPCIPSDTDCYFEVRLDGPAAPAGTAGMSGYPIKVGLLHATQQALGQIGAGIAAGSQRGAYLFSCGNGNLQTGGAGYAFAKIICCREDCVGLLVCPTRREAVLYVNAARVAPLPIGTAGGGGLDWGKLLFVVDLSHLGQSVTITGRQCPS